MFPCDGALDVSLVLNSTSPGKYGRLWRRYFLVRIFISISRRRSTPNGDEVSSATPSYVSLPSPTPEFENKHDPVGSSSNNDNSTGFRGAISSVRRSFGRGSFTDYYASPPHVPVPQSPTGEHGGCIDLTTQSQHTIDVQGIEEEQNRRRSHINGIVRKKDVSSLNKFGGVPEVATALGSSLEFGICNVPQVLCGWNTVKAVCRRGFSDFFFEACNHYTNLLLLIAAILSSVVEIMKKQPLYKWRDPIVIVVALLFFIIVPAAVNFRRSKKAERKLKEKESRQVTVTRSGQTQCVSISSIVVGDLVHLKKEDRVPADGLYVDGSGLELEEALNAKIDEKNPFLFFGSKVANGSCRMIVTTVGAERVLGEVLSMVAHDSNEKKLLESRIQKPYSWIEYLALFVSVMVILIQLIRLIIMKHDADDGSPERPELKGNFSVVQLMEILEGILLKPRGRASVVGPLIVVVFGFQYGVPLVITVSLAYWKEKAESGDAKPQNVTASCTMRLVTKLCIDATGGLTCQPREIEVKKFWIGEEDMTSDSGVETDQVVVEALRRGIDVSILAPGVLGSQINDHVRTWINNKWVAAMGSSGQKFDVHDRNPSSERRGNIVLMKANGDEEVLRGNASDILNMCSHYYDCRGVPHNMENKKRVFEQLITDMETEGLYPVAFAHKQIDVQELIEDRLNLLALVGLKFSCHEETKLALQSLRNANIGVILVSEDGLSAARAIASELGIYEPNFDHLTMEGEEIRDLNSIERSEKVKRLTVMGSSLPKDKVLLIQSLQQNGDVVAYFGGMSTNDIAALKIADLGIVGNGWALDFTSEYWDIVVFQRYMAALIPILEFGRCAYYNIQKFFQLQLTACFSGLLLALVATIHTGDSPISPLELIWLNVVMYISGSLMMTMEVNCQEELTIESNKRTESLLSRAEWEDVAAQVFYQAFVFLFLEFKVHDIRGLNKEVREVMIFNSFFICQILNQLRVMNLQKKEILLKVFQNYWFSVALGIIMLTQVLVVQFAEELLRGIRLNGQQWVISCIVAAFPLWLHFVMKMIERFPRESVNVILPQNLRFSATLSTGFFRILIVPVLLCILPLQTWYCQDISLALVNEQNMVLIQA